MTDIHKTIDTIIQTHKVILFMKGTKEFPQCGFSHQVVQILRNENINFQDINVLEDEHIRQGIKTYSNWPTIPQLYINGEFIGGCDIVNEMHESGELSRLLTTIEPETC